MTGGSVPSGPAPIRIGVSACLLGQRVRYDGGHKHDRCLTDTLGRYVQWVPVCPEMELGLGAPREPMRLEDSGGEVRLITEATRRDLTRSMRRWARARAAQLLDEDLSGFVLKRDSPSCGMERVNVYGAKGRPRKTGRGLFAEALLQKQPNLPVEEEGRLSDPRLRENWVERVFAYHALQRLWRSRWKLGDLVDFHTRYKLVLLAHSPQALRELGRMVAEAKGRPRARLRQEYETAFMQAMKKIATRKKNANVLQHMAGYFKKRLDAASRAELAELIEAYRSGWTPLVVPLTLIRHYARVCGATFLQQQAYLHPHPAELGLRNHP